MANVSLANPQESQLEDGNVGFLGADEDNDDVPPRRCMGPLGLMKKLKRPPLFGGEADFVEIDGLNPIEAIGADWSDALVCEGGVLCSPAPVVFDVCNAGGTVAWGPAARGAIVVSIRGVGSFEEMALNAATAGALALIVVDNEPTWSNDWVMTMDTDTSASPTIPAVLVSKESAECMCSGRNDLRATIVRRATTLGTREIARNVLAAAWPF